MTHPFRASLLRLPRHTARLRLTVLYGGLFLLSGIALVASTYVLFERRMSRAPWIFGGGPVVMDSLTWS
jgi:hypothetical protein